MSSDFANSWQTHTAGNLKQTYIQSLPHVVLYDRLHLIKISVKYQVSTWKCNCHIRRLLSGVSSNMQKTVHIIKASVPSVTRTQCCWSEVAPDSCMVWSAAACHWQGNRPVTWTATCMWELLGQILNICFDGMNSPFTYWCCTWWCGNWTYGETSYLMLYCML